MLADLRVAGIVTIKYTLSSRLAGYPGFWRDDVLLGGTVSGILMNSLVLRAAIR